MYITESKLRSVIRNELILEEISGTKKRTLQTLLLALAPLIASPNNPETAGDKFKEKAIPALISAIEEAGLNPEDDDDADKIRVITLRFMRGGLERAIKKHLPKRDEEFDASSVMKR